MKTSSSSAAAYIAVPIQMRYNIRSRDVGARQCRAPTGVPHVNDNRYIPPQGIIEVVSNNWKDDNLTKLVVSEHSLNG